MKWEGMFTPSFTPYRSLPPQGILNAWEFFQITGSYTQETIVVVHINMSCFQISVQEVEMEITISSPYQRNHSVVVCCTTDTSPQDQGHRPKNDIYTKSIAGSQVL